MLIRYRVGVDLSKRGSLVFEPVSYEWIGFIRRIRQNRSDRWDKTDKRG